MIYLYAFLIGGCLCGLFQFLWMTTKVSPLTLLKIGFALAAVLASLGLTGKLISLAGAGFFVMVVGAGDAVYSGTVALLGGDPIPLLEFFAVIAVLLLFGLSCGYLTPVASKKQRREQ
ncbi:MAG TPA: SpoVA/SpoVAEb family sporulation membrane protein [Clostridiales bacterium]|nr:SpoVA/SpoVAEb family sporulation membrane protein [Clostridiales bacterium]